MKVNYDRSMIPEGMSGYVADLTVEAGFEDGKARRERFEFTHEEMQPLYDAGYAGGRAFRKKQGRDNLIGLVAGLAIVGIAWLLLMGATTAIDLLVDLLRSVLS